MVKIGSKSVSQIAGIGDISHTNKYEVHINIERCATHSRLVSELDFCAYVGQG